MAKRIDTGNPIFYRMQEDFSEAINDTVKRMLRLGVNEGRVTCTLGITLIEEEITGSHGMARMAKTPVFEHKVKTAVSQGIQVSGEAQMRGTEIRLDQDGNPIFSKYGGQMSLFDEEENDDTD